MSLSPTGLGSKTTAQEALRGTSLAGKTAIVTGASSGIGVETARALALAGAQVVMACRSVEAGRKIASEIGGDVEVEALDLADLGSVRAFAERHLAKKKPLDLLINNAGIMASPFGLTPQGYESQMGTNHLGHFLLTVSLLDALGASAGARVVNVSSNLHSRGTRDSVLATLDTDRAYQSRKYVPFTAYGDSKLANILFTRALAARLPKSAATFALHPGVIATNLTRSVVARIPFAASIYRAVGRVFLKSIPQGAATSVFAATAPELVGHSGLYLADCNEAPCSHVSRDEALAEQVWAVSEAAVSEYRLKIRASDPIVTVK